MDSPASSSNGQACGHAWFPLLMAGGAVVYAAIVAGMLAAIIARVVAVTLVALFG